MAPLDQPGGSVEINAIDPVPGPILYRQLQQAGMVKIDLAHQPLGGLVQLILIGAGLQLGSKAKLALQGRRLERKAGEQQPHGSHDRKGKQETSFWILGCEFLGGVTFNWNPS
jgi:hypothetical protein